MNVENVHSAGHSPVSQIATHILCILSSTVSPPDLNSSARTSSGPAVGRMARATCVRSGEGSCSQYSCSIPFPFSAAYTNFMLITTKLFNDSVAVTERRPSGRLKMHDLKMQD